jgi:hypothetical protein
MQAIEREDILKLIEIDGICEYLVGNYDAEEILKTLDLTCQDIGMYLLETYELADIFYLISEYLCKVEIKEED